MFTRCVLMFVLVALPASVRAADPWLTFPGKMGRCEPKYIVLVSGDEEYRSEEALPMLAQILSTHHGFKTTVLFAIDPADGTVNPNINNNIPGLEALEKADLLILGLRFRNLPDEQMKHFDAYFKSGKPIIGLRTSTHAFNLNQGSYKRYSWGNKETDFLGGFGKQVLGETWVAHHGAHGKQGTRALIADGAEKHPMLKGIKSGEIFGTSDVYTVKTPLAEGSSILLNGEVTESLKPDSPGISGSKNSPMMPVAWTKKYNVGGKDGQVFTTTMGASQDLESEGLRRLIVNASYVLLGQESSVPERADVTYVTPYKPSMFKFKKPEEWKPGKLPADYAK